MRLGNKQPAGDISFEFSYGAFDDFPVSRVRCFHMGSPSLILI